MQRDKRHFVFGEINEINAKARKKCEQYLVISMKEEQEKSMKGQKNERVNNKKEQRKKIKWRRKLEKVDVVLYMLVCGGYITQRK